jgi:hypothetical protein
MGSSASLDGAPLRQLAATTKATRTIGQISRNDLPPQHPEREVTTKPLQRDTSRRSNSVQLPSLAPAAAGPLHAVGQEFDALTPPRVTSRTSMTSGMASTSTAGSVSVTMSAYLHSPGSKSQSQSLTSPVHAAKLPRIPPVRSTKLAPISPSTNTPQAHPSAQDALVDAGVITRPASAQSRHGLIRPISQHHAAAGGEVPAVSNSPTKKALKIVVAEENVQPVPVTAVQDSQVKPSTTLPANTVSNTVSPPSNTQKKESTPVDPKGDAIPLQTYQTYSAMYQMYSEDCPEYQEYQRRWKEQQTAYAQARANRAHSTYSRSLYTPEPDVRSTTSSPTGSPYPAPGWCSPMDSARGSVGSVRSGAASPTFDMAQYPSPMHGASLVQEGTALCLLVSSSRLASVCASPIPGWKLVSPVQSPACTSPVAAESPQASVLSFSTASPETPGHRRNMSHPVVSFSTHVHGSSVSAETDASSLAKIEQQEAKADTVNTTKKISQQQRMTAIVSSKTSSPKPPVSSAVKSPLAEQNVQKPPPVRRKIRVARQSFA